jgi:hypothetical protein
VIPASLVKRYREYNLTIGKGPILYSNCLIRVRVALQENKCIDKCNVYGIYLHGNVNSFSTIARASLLGRSEAESFVVRSTAESQSYMMLFLRERHEPVSPASHRFVVDW